MNLYIILQRAKSLNSIDFFTFFILTNSVENIWFICFYSYFWIFYKWPHRIMRKKKYQLKLIRRPKLKKMLNQSQQLQPREKLKLPLIKWMEMQVRLPTYFCLFKLAFKWEKRRETFGVLTNASSDWSFEGKNRTFLRPKLPF